ncbi:MAG TPA: twin-arginine translocase TatA/TatE family subunit [Phycisphaerae bacterium]|nr:twin-arginine translocase TatA/TatE family subunit [Phycisphaerae bacterium]
MSPHEHLLAFFPNLGWQELLIIAFIALLIFGRRLPEVGRSLGKGIVEFKKGLQDTGDEIKRANSTPTNSGGSAAHSPSEKKSEPPSGE